MFQFSGGAEKLASSPSPDPVSTDEQREVLEFNFSLLKITPAAHTLALIDLPAEIQLKIYEFIFGSCDLELRKVFRKKDLRQTGEQTHRRPINHVRFRYVDAISSNDILCTCKAILPIAIQAQQNSYSGIFRIVPDSDSATTSLEQLWGPAATSSLGRLLTKTRTLSMSSVWSKEMLPAVAKLFPRLQRIEMVHFNVTRNHKGVPGFLFNYLSNLTRYRTVKSSELRWHFEEQLKLLYEEGELDWYFDDTKSFSKLNVQDCIEFLSVAGCSGLQMIIHTNFIVPGGIKAMRLVSLEELDLSNICLLRILD